MKAIKTDYQLIELLEEIGLNFKFQIARTIITEEPILLITVDSFADAKIVAEIYKEHVHLWVTHHPGPIVVIQETEGK